MTAEVITEPTAEKVTSLAPGQTPELTNELGMLTAPTDLEDAMARSDSKLWKAAVDKEMGNMNDLGGRINTITSSLICRSLRLRDAATRVRNTGIG
eukprot:COSAG06_NODE_124_length_22969_cov_136.895310_14_plen_96_part_00